MAALSLPNVDGDNMFDATNDLISDLEMYASDGIDYLYQLEPRSQNLFWAGGFREAGAPGAGDDPGAGLIRPFYNAAYRIKSIKIEMPTIEYEVNKLTRIPTPKAINWPQKISITWMEDVYHSVRKYHLDWLQRWYMREFDCWRCGAQGKFRAMRIIPFHYVNAVSDTATVIEAPRIQAIMAIDIGGMVPMGVGDEWTWSHSEDGNEGDLNISYMFSSMHLYYSKELADPDANTSADVGTEKASYKDVAMWNPIGFAQDGDKDDNAKLEQARLIRATTSSTSTDTAVG
jgi:hypothetical protein